MPPQPQPEGVYLYHDEPVKRPGLMSRLFGNK
jgi:hypothetical protein